METSEMPAAGQGQDQPSQAQIRALVSGIQQASASGATSLPQRDIPQQTTHIVHDNQAAPNHVPDPVPEAPQYYIPDDDPNRTQEILEKEATKEGAWDQLYDEIHVPLLMSVLFLMFQLPITHKYFRAVVPAGFNTDGNQNIIGYTVFSALFGLTFYGLTTFLRKVK
jgi:hypothetical protein